MINRQLSQKIQEIRGKFPIVTVIGPRQSGKTTLLKAEFPDLPYVTLEDVDIRLIARSDPRGFLKNYPNGVFLDEVQNVPELFSYIQGIVDAQNVPFVLSGSQNFTLMENITQSLAGRTIVLKLLPLSKAELDIAAIRFETAEEYIFTGMYPRIYDRNIAAGDFYGSYLTTYVEKDVRQIKNVGDLSAFTAFLKLCAGRIGQVLNIHSLAIDAGISANTAKSWLSVLEASFILYLLPPYHQNFNKRIIKSPKLYFTDTGLACRLLELENFQQLNSHFLRGGLFENFIVNEFVKARFNSGRGMNLYYWQAKNGKEIDLMVESGGRVHSFEIKSSKTFSTLFFENLAYWKAVSGDSESKMNVIFGGETSLSVSNGSFVSWRDLSMILNY
ncbi:MAG TPA: ATP-binding protein [Catalimonadaceae bacterium]|nr:ATP-binding protein [Catalimonadaceae bacterium]HPI10165.1 ATP-binding protein [Catalimonadaceae bacterium]